MILCIHSSDSFSQKLKIDAKWYHLLAIAVYPNTANFCIFVIHNNRSFIFQNLKVVGPLGGKFDVFSPLGFEIKSVFDYRTSQIKFYSVGTLICYLNEKKLIHGQVTATISKFSVQIFETHFRFFSTSAAVLQCLQFDSRKFSVCIIVFSLYLSSPITCNFESSQAVNSLGEVFNLIIFNLNAS